VINIVLADDHQILRESVRKNFESAGEKIVGEASNGEDAVRLAQQLKPDVVVMDISMPILDGVSATRRINETVPETRVVVLTMHDDIERTRQALEAGAVGYLSKGCSFADVLATVRAAAAGDTGLSPALASTMLSVAQAQQPAAQDDILSPRQVEILQGIADGLSTKQAARELGITQKTVHNHLNAIYRRLDTQSLTHAVLSAVRLGIIDLREQ
jgi:DNA-binding NarL/FixJ family response regulator